MGRKVSLINYSNTKKETNLLAKSKSKKNLTRFFMILASAIIILPLLFIGTYLTKNFIQNYVNKENLPKISVQAKKFNSQIINESTPLGQVAAAETNNSQGRVLASENYKINTVNLGGSVAVISKQQNLPLKIENIKSKSFINNNKNEVYLVVSWTTNKTAISQLNYAKNNGQDPQTIKENSYGFNHSVVISGLDPGTSYIYQIESTDQWGNSQISKYFGIYTASNPLSVFDLISNAVGETFGWAIKK